MSDFFCYCLLCIQAEPLLRRGVRPTLPVPHTGGEPSEMMSRQLESRDKMEQAIPPVIASKDLRQKI